MSVLGDSQNLTGHGPEQPVLVDRATSLPEVPSNLNCFASASVESWAASLNLAITRLCRSSLTSLCQPFRGWQGWGRLQAGPAKRRVPAVSWPGAASAAGSKHTPGGLCQNLRKRNEGVDGAIQWEHCRCRIGSLLCTQAV